MAIICETCKCTNWKVEPTGSSIKQLAQRDIPLEKMRSSAEQRCFMCQVACRVIDVAGIGETTWEDPKVALIIRTGHPMEIDVSSVVSGFRISKTTSVSGTIDGNDLWPYFGAFAEIPYELDTPRSRTLAKNWIQDCVQNHTSCKVKVSSDMPTRLLDLIPQIEDIEIRLVESSKMEVKYIALSHCWGQVAALKTTPQNVSSMFQNISFSSLPKTFQDAVSICRDFGIRYLWIDSLCIIQGEVEEWSREASRMASVYGNAFLVLAAAAAEGDHCGMFPPRQQHYCHTVDFDWHDAKIQLKVQPQRGHYEQGAFSYGQNYLDSRGWCFQERLLGLRVLQYHAAELIWDCNERRRCECGVGDRLNLEDNYYNLSKMLKLGDNSLSDLYRAWRLSIVEMYSIRNLTFLQDKLPAISGVAAIFKRKFNDNYLAGIWAKDLLRGLLWYHEGLLNGCWVPRRYRAPSWSWASVNCSVKHVDLREGKACVELVEAHCRFHGQDMLGEVIDGWLTLTGSLIQGWTTLPPKDEAWVLPSLPLLIGEGRLENVGFWITESYLGLGSFLAEDGAEIKTAIRENDETGPKSTPVHEPSAPPTHIVGDRNLPLWCFKLVEIAKNDPPLDIIMILGRSLTRVGKFERIGLASIPTAQNLFRDAARETISIV